MVVRTPGTAETARGPRRRAQEIRQRAGFAGRRSYRFVVNNNDEEKEGGGGGGERRGAERGGAGAEGL